MTEAASAPGESSLAKLLTTLTITLHPSTFVFLSFRPDEFPPSGLLTNAIMTFRESEGLTLITALENAKDHQITEYIFPCRMITCNVHSSLEAVGFMMTITARLTEAGIGANPVSGFYHDHLFVPLGREAEAVKELEELVEEAKMGQEDD
ncbi:hypothetical protein ACLMJK_003677 [Lecanora helva]